MAQFETGVFSYVHAKATVNVFFPVDKNGTAEICCRQCRFFRSYSNTCDLNGEVCAFPTKFVGANCPLELVPEEDVKISSLEDEI